MNLTGIYTWLIFSDLTTESLHVCRKSTVIQRDLIINNYLASYLQILLG
jgi:hypothetical protein